MRELALLGFLFKKAWLSFMTTKRSDCISQNNFCVFRATVVLRQQGWSVWIHLCGDESLLDSFLSPYVSQSHFVQNFENKRLWRNTSLIVTLSLQSSFIHNFIISYIFCRLGNWNIKFQIEDIKPFNIFSSETQSPSFQHPKLNHQQIWKVVIDDYWQKCP